jgi:hypothetical protein
MDQEWVTSVIDVYFELRPFFETQALYRSRGLTGFDYLYYEVDWLINSVWDTTCDEFRNMPGSQYLLDKYNNSPKIEIDDEDRKNLWKRFLYELGFLPCHYPFEFKLRGPSRIQKQP